MEDKKQLVQAVIEVMKAVKGIDKTMTIGSGNNSYKGVSDQEVKKIIGDAMAKNGLCILPIKITPKIQIDRWEEMDSYSKAMKTKQSIFTEVMTEYLLLHESGESQIISGYGHGTDTQDKGAGKATTYALKYTLLYTFLVPTGKIDDADNTHSDLHDTPKPTNKKTQETPKVQPQSKPTLPNERFLKLIENIRVCNKKEDIEKQIETAKAHFELSMEQILTLSDWQ
jgi:hypothetical protein